jgi:NAD(P)-dependent dehydrogenase (short-subunit alcohol dehydrogenase family)
MGRLEGKVAVVLGGGSSGPGIGNGRAICLRFAEEGAHVLVVDRDGAAADETVAQITARGGEARAMVGDVTDAKACAAVVDAATAENHAIDALVYNVGITGPSTTIPDVEEDDWDEVMRVNAKGAMLAAKYAIPAMRSGSSIVNISSIGAIRTSERPVYAASKGAVVSLTIAMAGQHGRQGIRVNAILPGAVWTPLVAAEAASPGDVPELRRRRADSTLLKTEGTPWDVANAAVFLASDEARWITGHSLVVDGGAAVSRLAWRPPAGGLA